jgi:hypothetical protein
VAVKADIVVVDGNKGKYSVEFEFRNPNASMGFFVIVLEKIFSSCWYLAVICLTLLTR